MAGAALPAHALSSSAEATLREVERYHITSSDLINILFPSQDALRVNFSQKRRQNKLLFCPFLRQRLKRTSYPWHKHPNCSRYNVDNGCMILLPFCSKDYNNAQPYDNMLEFFEDIVRDPIFSELSPDKQRKRLYRVLNDGLGGPHGKVCVFYCI